MIINILNIELIRTFPCRACRAFNANFLQYNLCFAGFTQVEKICLPLIHFTTVKLVHKKRKRYFRFVNKVRRFFLRNQKIEKKLYTFGCLWRIQRFFGRTLDHYFFQIFKIYILITFAQQNIRKPTKNAYENKYSKIHEEYVSKKRKMSKKKWQIMNYSNHKYVNV